MALKRSTVRFRYAPVFVRSLRRTKAVPAKPWRRRTSSSDFAQSSSLRPGGPGMKFFYVYQLQSDLNPDRHYTGITTDLGKRLAADNRGEVAHTRKFRPWRIEVAVAFRAEEKARAFESYLKTEFGTSLLEAAFLDPGLRRARSGSTLSSPLRRLDDTLNNVTKSPRGELIS